MTKLEFALETSVSERKEYFISNRYINPFLMIQPLFNHYWVRVIEILCVYLVLLAFASNFFSCLLILNKGYTFDKVIARIWIVTNFSWSVQLYFLVILISKTIGLWHSNDLHMLCGKVCTHCLPSWCNPEALALVQSPGSAVITAKVWCSVAFSLDSLASE